MKVVKNLAKKRGKARRLAMQAIFQWQMTGDSITGIKQQFLDEINKTKVDVDFFIELVSGVVSSISVFDPMLEKHMNRTMESVDLIERAILRLSCFELVNRLDVPYRVVLNEAVNITKEYSTDNSHTFINAVLDKVAKDTRQLEFSADK